MGFFSDLQSDEHPLLIRILMSAIIALVLTFGLWLIVGVLDLVIGSWAYIVFVLASIVLLGLNIKKLALINPVILLIIPLMVISLWLNLDIYAGVISRWPTLIITMTWTLAAYYAKGRQKFRKLAIYGLATAIIVVTLYFSLPKYTYAQAKEILAEELNIKTEQLGPGLGRMPIIPCLGPTRPSIFVESSYFFDAESAGEVTTYLFNPVSGEWQEANLK